MKARALTGASTIDGLDWRLPLEAHGAVVAGVAEVTTDDDRHQAYGLVLVLLNGRRVALWWQRDPSRRFVLTPF